MKTTFLAIIVAAVLIAAAIIFSDRKNSNNDAVENKNNVSIVDGKQIITISAKGGYTPKTSTAKADMPTVIRVTTNGTFDCSSAITIPALGYRTNLPLSGVTDVDVPPQKAGTKLEGLCSMGMYSFAVDFK